MKVFRERTAEGYVAEEMGLLAEGNVFKLSCLRVEFGVARADAKVNQHEMVRIAKIEL